MIAPLAGLPLPRPAATGEARSSTPSAHAATTPSRGGPQRSQHILPRDDADQERAECTFLAHRQAVEVALCEQRFDPERGVAREHDPVFLDGDRPVGMIAR